MKDKNYMSIPELAEFLGISRIAVYKKVKKGQIEAEKIGRNYAIPRRVIAGILGKTLSKEQKRKIDRAVRKTVKEYGEVLFMLGKG